MRDNYVMLFLMESIIRLRSSSAPIWARIARGLFVVASLGGLGYSAINVFFTPVNYTISTFYGVLLYEWFAIAKPIIIPVVPALFIALIDIFQKTPLKKLALYSLAAGIILTIPPFLYTRWVWMKLERIIDNLPITEVKYHRHSPIFPDDDGDMSINFMIPSESFKTVNHEIERQTGYFGPQYYVEIKLQDGTFLNRREFDSVNQQEIKRIRAFISCDDCL